MDLHKGDDVHVEVEMTDDNGDVTPTYDIAGGITWESTDPNKVAVADDDDDPHDAVLEVLDLTDSPVRIAVSFDGDPGTGVRTVGGESEELNVVPGEATGARVVVKITAAQV